MSTKIKTKRVPSRDLPMDEEELRELAWKARGKREKGLVPGYEIMQIPCSDAPKFIRWQGDVVARFYNNGEWLDCYWYNEKSKSFVFSEEMTEELCQEEFH